MKNFLIFVITLTLLFPHLTNAQGNGEVDGAVLQDKTTIIKAQVEEVVREGLQDLPGFVSPEDYQTLRVRILEGEKKGEVITVENDYLPLKTGEKFYLVESISWEDGSVHYIVYDKYRLPMIYFLIGLFVLAVLIFGGVQGVRGLVSLIGSLLLIVFVLMPGILKGYSPILVTIGVSSLIIGLGSYITHGFNKTTTAAVLGMIVTVLITGTLAYFSVKLTGLSGFESEEAVFLNWNTRGSIDFVGLLFGGVMIGLLGVLYDVAIGQAITVEELREAGPQLSRKHIFKRALRIGKEHTGALVNTLAIAYVGASLPLLLLFYGDSSSLSHIINREVFAAEIVRTMVGSLGLVIAVPITTLLSVTLLVKKTP